MCAYRYRYRYTCTSTSRYRYCSTACTNDNLEHMGTIRKRVRELRRAQCGVHVYRYWKGKVHVSLTGKHLVLRVVPLRYVGYVSRYEQCDIPGLQQQLFNGTYCASTGAQNVALKTRRESLLLVYYFKAKLFCEITSWVQSSAQTKTTTSKIPVRSKENSLCHRPVATCP